MCNHTIAASNEICPNVKQCNICFKRHTIVCVLMQMKHAQIRSGVIYALETIFVFYFEMSVCVTMQMKHARMCSHVISVSNETCPYV